METTEEGGPSNPMQTTEGEKRAFLGGFSYPKDRHRQLYGGANAAINMKKCLLEHLGFKEENITLRTDLSLFNSVDNKTSVLLDNLFSFITESKKRDRLLIFLAGHGDYHLDEQKKEMGHYFVGPDKQVIREDDFNYFIELLPEEVSLTIIADFCYSGGIVRGYRRWFIEDLTEEKYKDCPSRLNILNHYDTVMQRKRAQQSKQVIFMHATQPFEEGYSRLVQTKRGRETVNVFTDAIIKVVEGSGGNVSDYDMIRRCRVMCSSRGQVPGLSSSLSPHTSLFLGGVGRL